MAADVICKSYIEQLKFELNSISNNYEKAHSHFFMKTPHSKGLFLWRSAIYLDELQQFQSYSLISGAIHHSSAIIHVMCL